MDFTLISSAISSINTAKDMLRSAVTLRDMSILVAEMHRMNDQLLKAQDALFAHNAQLLALQNDHFELTQKLRKATEALNERANYSLFEVAQGQFAYRVNSPPTLGRAIDPFATQPEHYLCQSCFDTGRKVVLILGLHPSRHLFCPVCKTELSIWAHRDMG